MRILKKSLCLVLAMIFVLGLCTIGAGAFTDDAKVTYKDAVNVMAGLGVIKGDDNDGDGKFEFRPKDTITRAEAAVLIARMILGDNYEKLPKAGTTFTDVGPGMSEWAQSAIAFCEARGIVNGRGDGKFYPQDNVTGIEMAKMLLCANGYGGDGQFTGRGWNINVFTEATTNKVFKGTADSVDFEAPATREECAQYTLNTLQNVKQLTVDSKGNVVEGSTLGEQVWNMKSYTGQLVESEDTGAKYSTIEYETVDDKGVAKLEKLSFKFDYKSAGIDSLNLIAHEITVYVNDEKDEKEGFYTAYNLEDNSTTFSAFFQSYDAIYKNVTSANKANADLNPSNVPYWYNYTYQKTGDANYTDMFGGTYGVATFGAMSGKESSLSFNAATLIYNGEGALIAMTNSGYTAGKVTALKSDSISIESKTWAEGATPTVTVSTQTIKAEDYTAYDGIAVKDIVVVQPVGSLYKIQPVTTKDIKVTSVDSSYNVNPVNVFVSDARKSSAYSADLVTGSSNKLTPSSWASFGGMFASWQAKNPNLVPGETYTFYMAPDGSYVDVAAVTEAAGDFFYVANAFSVTTSGTVDTEGATATAFYVKTVNGAGEVKTYKIAKKLVTSLGLTAANVKTTIGKGVYTYALDTDGNVKTLTAEANTFTKAAKYNSYITAADSTMYYVTSDTKVFYLKNDDGNFEVTTIASLPSTAFTAAQLFAYGVTGGSGKELKAVWIDTAPVDTSSAVSGSYIFIGSTSAGGSELVGKEIYNYYTAYVDGTKVDKLYVENDDVITASNAFYTYKVTDNVYTLTPYTKTSGNNTTIVVTANETDFNYNTATGKFYTNADGVDISKVALYNISRAADSNGTYFVLDTFDQVAAHIANGGTISITYLAKTAGNGNQTPIQAMFITAAG